MTTTPETLTAESMIAEALDSLSTSLHEPELSEERTRAIATALRTAGLLVTPGAPSSAPPLTDAEWREFQSIPDQGYSHRHWVDTKIAERVTAAGVATQEPSETIKCDRCGEPLPALADLPIALLLAGCANSGYAGGSTVNRVEVDLPDGRVVTCVQTRTAMVR